MRIYKNTPLTRLLRLFSIPIALFFIFFLSCNEAGGNEWYADSSTGIQTTIDNASYGDSIYIKKGNYHEGRIFMKEGVNLIGVPGDFGQVIISGDPGKTVIWAASHTIIANLIIQNGEIGIRCPEGDEGDIAIHNNLIRNNITGILIECLGNVTIINNTITKNEERGMGIFINPNAPLIHCKNNIISFNGSSVNGSSAGYYYDIEFIQQDPLSGELNGFFDLDTISLDYNDIYSDPKLYYDPNFNNVIFTWLSSTNDVKYIINLPSPAMFGSGNFSKDPSFIDSNNGEGHLFSYSPCIDSGDPNMNYSLEPEPNGGRINLGFYGNTSQSEQSIDSDNDGISDSLEGTGDMDRDGINDWEDVDSVIIPLPGNILRNIEQSIQLHLMVYTNGYDNQVAVQGIGFKDTQITLAELEKQLPEGRFPYEILRFKIEGLPQDAHLAMSMIFPEEYKAFGISHLITLSDNASWQSIPFEKDPNSNGILFTLKDGNPGDNDRVMNGEIEFVGAIMLPNYIDRVNPGKCFIASLDSRLQDNPVLSFLPGAINRKTTALPDIGMFPSLLYTLSIPFLFLFLCLLLVPLLCAFLSQWQIIKRSLITLFIPQKGVKETAFFILLIPVLILVYSSLGYAQLKEDIQIINPNPVGSGARALAMGGAFIGVADDATAASWNPAGLIQLVKPEISWVETYNSRRENPQSEKRPGTSDEYRLSLLDINYLSMAFPGRLFRKNFVFSLNYQHLYDFSKRIPSDTWRSTAPDPYLSIDNQASNETSGGLRAISPALAVMVSPKFTLGLTLNIWSNKFCTNEWVRRYHKDGSGEIGTNHQPITTHLDIIEQYTLSGINFHFGFLWSIAETIRLGGVIKTPFKADVIYKKEKYSIEEYSKGDTPNKYTYTPTRENWRLYMPLSYGIGIAYQPLEQLLFDLDIYRTEWEGYELTTQDGRTLNPITGYSKTEAGLKSTYQIHCGGEYVFITKKSVLPTIRGGIFYDPEPSPNGRDNYYGLSLGFGMTIREKLSDSKRRSAKRERKDIMSIDTAYQYRWGRNVHDPMFEDVHASTNIDTHFFYVSIIYYLH